MKMIITNIEYFCIRKFSKLALSFVDEHNKPYKNSFIMMGNGTGKTTTITLIKGVLDGTADRWDSETVRSFAPSNESASEGFFKLHVLFDDKTYIYTLKLDYSNGTAQTFCTTASQGGLGPRRFPSSLTGLFTPEFVHRFVFDGEQATKAMDNKSNEAEQAIKYLYRLDVFDEISRANRLILTAIQDAEGGGAGTAQSVRNLRTRQEKIGANIKRLSQRKNELANFMEQKKIQKGDIDSQIAKIDAKYQSLCEKKRDAEDRRNQLHSMIDLCIAKILADTKSPYLVAPALCKRMYEFGNSMTKLKLPKTISKDFFKELAHEPKCICGREIGPVEKNAILLNAERYLGSDQQSVLNNIKSSLMNSVYDNRLKNSFDELSQYQYDLKITDDNLLVIEDDLAKAGGEEAQRLRGERDLLIDEIGRLSAEQDIIDSKDDANLSLTEDNNLHKARQIFDELEAKIASATRTNEALRRRDIVEGLISQMKEKATQRLKHDIIKKANEKLRIVISDDIIEIDSIDKYIQLKGKTGASEAQTLSIAYCFLGTMFEDSELQFPFVIDSPAGKMDFSKRRAVANILPTLFNQLISFVTSAEVEQFADQFYGVDNSQFITVIADPAQEKIEVHNGNEFFDSYQRDHREEEA